MALKRLIRWKWVPALKTALRVRSIPKCCSMCTITLETKEFQNPAALIYFHVRMWPWFKKKKQKQKKTSSMCIWKHVCMGLFKPGHFMRFLRSDRYLISQNDSILISKLKTAVSESANSPVKIISFLYFWWWWLCVKHLRHTFTLICDNLCRIGLMNKCSAADLCNVCCSTSVQVQ